MKGKRVIITGGTGLIGRKVTQLLLEVGAKVSTVSLDKFYQPNHIIGDLSDFEFCQEITEKADYVFHIAGVKGGVGVTKTHPASMFIPCIQMNTNILEACRINGIKNVLFVSSVGAYAPAEVLKESNPEGEPMDEFPGWAKRTAEKQIFAYRKQYGLKYKVVRPTNTYGEGDNFDPNNAMFIPSLIAKIYRGDNPVIIWGDGSAIRDFVYSGDVAQGIVDAMIFDINAPLLNLGGAKEYSIKEVIETLASFLNFRFKFDKTKPSGFPRRVMDSSLAREFIGYDPKTSLYEGLKKTWNWYSKNSEEQFKKQNYFKEFDNELLQ